MDEESENTPTTFAQAGEAALADLQSAGTNEQAQQDSATESPVAQAPAQPVEQAQAQAAIEQFFEFDRRGQRHKLSKAEADYLVNFGLEAYERAQAQAGRQEQPAAPAQSQAQDPTARLISRIDNLEKQLQEATTERQVEKITQKLHDAMGKVKLYQELKEPEHQGLFRDLTWVRQYQNPNMSPETAAQEAEKVLDSLLRSRASAYVQSKVEQAGKRVESGGTPAATSQKPLGAKDLHNGNVMKSALRALQRTFSS